MKRKSLTALAIAGILVASAASATGRDGEPPNKYCPGWGSPGLFGNFYVDVLKRFGINVGDWLGENCR